MDIFSEEKQDAQSFLAFVLRHKWRLLLGGLAGASLGLLVFIITPEKYMAHGIIYPANTYTRDQVISNPQFGHEVEAEQLMQLLESRSLRDSVVKTFDLLDYYELDSSKQEWRDQLTKHYVKDVQFERTRYLSIVISAEFKDPELAANVVNYIIETVDQYKAAIFDQNIKDELHFLQRQVKNQEQKLAHIKQQIYLLKDTLKPENIIENYLLKSSKEQYYASEYVNTPGMAELIDEYRIQKQKYIDWKKDYVGAKEMAKRPILQNYVLDYAVPSYDKVSPKLSIYLAFGFLLGGILTLLLLVWMSIKPN